MTLVDTAGLRRRTKVAGTVDYYAQLRSERAAERAAVAIVVCDASEGVTSEDLRVAEMAMEPSARPSIALNKWDVTRTDLEDATARVADKLRQRPRVMAVSAQDRARRCSRLVAEALDLADRARERIPTPELNRFLADLQSARAAAGRARQAAADLLHGPVRDRARRASRSRSTTAARVTRDYAFFLENRLRERFGLEGVPLVIDFKAQTEQRR